VGYDFAIGYLKGGIDAWKHEGKEIDTIQSISADELSEIMSKNQNINILDVRKNSEHQSEHIMDSLNAPLDYINESMLNVQKDKTYYVHCAGGYRSMVFISTLKARGFENLIDVKGGFKEIKESGKFNVSAYVCPSTLL
jgi:rhodanese-related sulfurtransferase